MTPSGTVTVSPSPKAELRRPDFRHASGFPAGDRGQGVLRLQQAENHPASPGPALQNRVPVRLDGAARGDAQFLGMLPEIIIAAEAVKANRLKTIQLPQGLRSIGEEAFRGTAIEELVLPFPPIPPRRREGL